MKIMRIMCRLLLWTSLLAPTVATAAQEEKVIISYSSRDFSFLPAFVAAAKGFFRDENLEPVMVQMRAPVAATLRRL